MPRGGFLALSGLGYAAVVFLIRSERSPSEFIVFLALFGMLGGLWQAALFRARRRPPSVGWILASGFALRLALLPAGFDFERGEYRRLLLYDDDVWRYLWEGHAWSAGVDPARTPPEALEEYALEVRSPELFRALYDDPAWSEVWDNIGYRQFASPYPLVARALFRAASSVAPGSVAAWKLLIIGFEVGSIWLLALLGRRLGRSTAPAAAYAWCPLPIKEFAGSGHVDAAMIFLLLAGLYAALRFGSGPLGGALVGAAALVKPPALAAAPGLWRRFGPLAAIVPAAAFAWVVAAPPEGMKAYLRYWVFNPALPKLLPDERWLELGLPAASAGAAALWRFLRDSPSDESPARSTYWVLGAFLLTTPMLAPWYLCWILPFAALFEGWFWLLLSVSIFLSYHAHLGMSENFEIWLLEFALPAAGALLVRARTRS